MLEIILNTVFVALNIFYVLSIGTAISYVIFRYPKWF